MIWSGFRKIHGAFIRVGRWSDTSHSLFIRNRQILYQSIYLKICRPTNMFPLWSLTRDSGIAHRPNPLHLTRARLASKTVSMFDYVDYSCKKSLASHWESQRHSKVVPHGMHAAAQATPREMQCQTFAHRLPGIVDCVPVPWAGNLGSARGGEHETRVLGEAAPTDRKGLEGLAQCKACVLDHMQSLGSRPGLPMYRLSSWALDVALSCRCVT